MDNKKVYETREKDLHDKDYWNYMMSQLDREDSNSDRRYRRHNKSLDAMGENNAVKEAKSNQEIVKAFKEFDTCLGFFDSIDNEKLLEAIRKLNSKERSIIEYKTTGYTFEEIALILHFNVSAVKMSYFRAIEKIQKYF